LLCINNEMNAQNCSGSVLRKRGASGNTATQRQLAVSIQMGERRHASINKNHARYPWSTHRMVAQQA
jgi:hypothetical protein